MSLHGMTSTTKRPGVGDHTGGNLLNHNGCYTEFKGCKTGQLEDVAVRREFIALRLDTVKYFDRC